MRKKSLVLIILVLLFVMGQRVVLASQTINFSVRINPLVVKVSAPTEVDKGQVFAVEGRVSNRGIRTIKGVRAALELSDGSVLKAENELGDIQPGYTKTTSWQIKAENLGKLKLRIEAKGLEAISKESLSAHDTALVTVSEPTPLLIKIDIFKPSVRLWSPYVSTKHSKRPEFTLRWRGTDFFSGIASYTLKVRRDDKRTWYTLKSNTTATSYRFKGKMGHTYYFRVQAKDRAGNTRWSKVKKTIVPYNEGSYVLRKAGFYGYFKGSRSSYYLSTVRYSYRRGHTIVYKVRNAKSIGLISTKAKSRGKAKIYIDGKWVKTVDAYSSKTRTRQLIFNKTFSKKKTHYIKIVNLGTPGRARFDIDGIAVGR